jgi:hypothetical protein
MTSAVIDRLGIDWLERGAMDVRFNAPYYEGEQVAISITDLDDGRIKVDAGSRATGTAWLADDDDWSALPPAGTERADSVRTGVVLERFEKTLDLSQPGMSAPLDAWIGEERFAHPAIVLTLANEILLRNVTLGPWIHVSSEVRNRSAARDGERVEVRGKIEDAFERKGHEFAVLDVAILGGTRIISRVRHTAIWKLRKPV